MKCARRANGARIPVGPRFVFWPAAASARATRP